MCRVSMCFLAVLTVVVGGCGGTESDALQPQVSVSTPLSQTDVERFLAVVQNHEDALIPEFTPPDDDDPPDFTLPAKDIVACFRGKFRRVFDVERQGSVWERDEHWKQALSTQKISGARFASLVRNVSLAIMRVRLEARVDVSQLVTNAKRDVARATRIINQIDAAPPADQTRESKALRSRSAVELGRAVALLQFAELIQQIPDESGAQVRRFSARLKALLPARANEDLLAELSDLAVRDENTIERAGYEVEADESPRRSAGTRR